MTTTAASVNFNYAPGATFTGSVTLNDSDGNPVDLTGYTALMHIRREPTDDDPVFELSTANGRITLGGAAGTIDLEIPDTDTDLDDVDVDPEGETWWYDLYLTNTNPTPDSTERKLKGFVFAVYPITRL